MWIQLLIALSVFQLNWAFGKYSLLNWYCNYNQYFSL